MYIQNCTIALKFDRYIGSSAADVPVKFPSGAMIETNNVAASRFYEIL